MCGSLGVAPAQALATDGQKPQEISAWLLHSKLSALSSTHCPIQVCQHCGFMIGCSPHPCSRNALDELNGLISAERLD